MTGGTLDQVGVAGFYWCSTAIISDGTTNEIISYRPYFYNEGLNRWNSSLRQNACAIRCIKN
jgi:hypothetical protein